MKYITVEVTLRHTATTPVTMPRYMLNEFVDHMLDNPAVTAINVVED